jgi:hypothetical protein
MLRLLSFKTLERAHRCGKKIGNNDPRIRIPAEQFMRKNSFEKVKDNVR